FVVTECNLYQEILTKELKGTPTKTIYLAKKNINVEVSPSLLEDEIHLGYLGSINNIIDISKIKSIVQEINTAKPTTLHIIGDGENKDTLIQEVMNVGVKVIDHGRIYDAQEKQNVFDKCHFGLNIMKDSVC